MIKDRIILGIDPGTIVMGYGILKIEGNKPKLEAMGILQLNNMRIIISVCVRYSNGSWP